MKESPTGLYIALLSIHGLIRGNDLELGRDADTGGQTLYVVELAQALARHPDVAQVDLITRRIADDSVSADYASPLEKIADNFRIVRIDAGGDEYLLKEQLWDHLDAFTDSLRSFFREQAKLPDIFHSHYADAGYVGAHLANMLAVPLIHTGHSLGRVKRRRLLASGLSHQQVERRYNMIRRIEAEEMVLATAERVITSTYQEIEEQYPLYDHYQPEQMRVVPPGTDLEKFFPPTSNDLHSSLYHEIVQHLKTPEKPIILALSRPDQRKNIVALVEAFGQSPQLQKLANLIIVAGNRDDIDDLEQGAQEVFHELLVAIDRHELYGKVVMPKHHRRDQVPMLYRIATASGGVFVNPALTEPFGLTLIEAAASGLPIVATEDGGPRDIVANCHNGVLIDPLETDNIAKALLRLLKERDYWTQCSQDGLKGVREYYSWDAHAASYLALVKPIVERSEILVRKPIKRRKTVYRERAIVSDLDQNLLGDDKALKQLVAVLHRNRRSTKFVIATGRRLDSALRVMRKHNIPEPDILITSGGTEIYYAPELTADVAWARHIDYHWSAHKVIKILDNISGLKRQSKLEQSRFKLSYYIDPDIVELDQIKSLLHREEQSVHIYSAFGQFLDVMPQRASKGLALRYIADRWQIPLQRIFVAGGSGADEDMMRGNTLAAVVANRHHEELSRLVDVDQIYFARQHFSAGILEALTHYHFFEETQEALVEEVTI
jgi:sucrose-phosphate synthase